jgi:hydrogenase nickel incorporation protein HypA/HybF
MQELALAESILQTALAHASRVGARRIARLQVAIGQLSAMVVDLIQSHWDDISRGSLAEGARLDFRQELTRLLCLACDRLYMPRGRDLACPSCHSTRFKVISGHESRVEAIEIEPGEAFRAAFVDAEGARALAATEVASTATRSRAKRLDKRPTGRVATKRARSGSRPVAQPLS